MSSGDRERKLLASTRDQITYYTVPKVPKVFQWVQKNYSSGLLLSIIPGWSCTACFHAVPGSYGGVRAKRNWFATWFSWSPMTTTRPKCCTREGYITSQNVMGLSLEVMPVSVFLAHCPSGNPAELWMFNASGHCHRLYIADRAIWYLLYTNWFLRKAICFYARARA